MGDIICQLPVLASDWSEYELIDSGDRLKLERFGNVVIIRSEPKAWWNKSAPESWKRADCRYVDSDKKNSRWEFLKKTAKTAAPILDLEGVKFATKFMDGSKHLGVFPEQKPHWDFISDSVKKRIADGATEKPKLLNLFGYTGAASLVAARAGAAVTHVDASKPSVDWARKNQLVSGMEKAPVRWIVEDALKFVHRAARRADFYDAILLDPPAFGRGPKNELWKLEKMLPELLEACAGIISRKSMFVLLTVYNIEASAIMAGNMLQQFFPQAKTEFGELALCPSKGSNRLPLSIWAKSVF